MNATFSSPQGMIAGDGGDVLFARSIGLFQTTVNVTTIVGIENDDSLVGNALSIQGIK